MVQAKCSDAIIKLTDVAQVLKMLVSGIHLRDEEYTKRRDTILNEVTLFCGIEFMCIV